MKEVNSPGPCAGTSLISTGWPTSAVVRFALGVWAYRAQETRKGSGGLGSLVTPTESVTVTLME